MILTKFSGFVGNSMAETDFEFGEICIRVPKLWGFNLMVHFPQNFHNLLAVKLYFSLFSRHKK